MSKPVPRRPHLMAGIFGMALVVALYCVHYLLAGAGEGGLGAGWLLLLLLPGALAAHLGRRDSVEMGRYGALAGVVTAHFAAPLQVAVLAVGVIATDWARYAEQVGPQVASEVREAALPATVVTGLVVVGVTYVGCALAGWVGALIYGGARRRWR